MKAKFFVVCLLLAVLGLSVSMPAPAQEEKQKSEKFSALAHMPHGAGPAMVGAGARVNVDLWVNSYTSDEEAKAMAGALLGGGADALLKMLEKAKTIGKIRLTGRAGFYDFKLIRSHQTENGRRIYAVGDRPIGFLESANQPRSINYPFTIIEMQLNRSGEGEGRMSLATKVILDKKKNMITLENFELQPVLLTQVKRVSSFN